MTNKLDANRTIRSVAGVAALLICLAGNATAQARSNVAGSSSQELIGQLTKALSVTPAQATGGAGALFGLAKSRLSPADFGKVAASVPGIENLIKSAPAVSGNPAASGLSGIANSLPGGLGGLASVAGSFQKLGLSPQMAAKFVPIIGKFVESKGGAAVAKLLTGALK